MRILFILLLSLFLSFLAFSNEKTTPAHALSQSQFEVLKKWKLIASDGQVFSLTEENHKNEKAHFLNYGRGENILRIFPIRKKSWNTWINKMNHLMTSLPKSEKCDHPVRFQIDKKGQERKEKSICLSTLTDTERAEIKKLAEEWKSYLYDE